MQLKLSKAVSLILLSTSLYAQDYISIQYMHYDKESGETKIDTPTIEFNKDFGADYTLNISYTHDSLTGASPTFYDASSGASAKIPDSFTYQSDVEYGLIDYKDKRDAFGINFTTRFKSRDELNIGYNYSKESDYKSNEVSLNYLHYLDSTKNRSISIGISYQKNKISIPCYLGNSECDGISGASSKVVKKDLNVVNVEVGYTQILDKTSQIKGSIFYIYEDGYLSNPYMRVVKDYKTYPKITQESKPSLRKSYGATIEYAKAFNKRVSTILSYRYFHDNWGITSHTLKSKIYYDISDSLTINGAIRVYHQSKANFYSSKKDYFTNQKYASSDRRVSNFTSYDISMGATYKLNDSISINSAIGYYKQIKYFDSKYINFGIRYNF